MKNYQFKNKTKLLLSIICIAVISTGIYLGLQHDAKQAASSFVHATKKPETKVTFLIGSGHGAFINGKYQTSGKQSPEWANGLKIYEGYSVKLLATDLVSELLESDMDAFLLNSESYDYTNIERVQKVNAWLKIDKRIVYIDLHHNAQDCRYADYTDKYGIKGFVNGGARGIEVYTSIGQTESDTLANFIIKELAFEFPHLKFRTDYSDKDADKEANFTVLAQTYCPAVLIEFLFMTTFDDCKLIADEKTRERYIKAVCRACINYNNSL